MDSIDPAAVQALLNRRAQLQAQEAAAMGVQPAPAPVAAPVMSQAQFGGPRSPMTPQQIQQLAALLQRRQ